MKNLFVLLASSFNVAIGTKNSEQSNKRQEPTCLGLDSTSDKGKYIQTPEGPITNEDLAEPGRKVIFADDSSTEDIYKIDNRGCYREINGKRVYLEGTR